MLQTQPPMPLAASSYPAQRLKEPPTPSGDGREGAKVYVNKKIVAIDDTEMRSGH